MAQQSGTWADWANVAVTGLTFAVALALFLVGMRDRRRTGEDRERDQARKVWLWTEYQGSNPSGAFSVKPDRYEYLRWSIVNSSGDPIIDCRVNWARVPTGQVAAETISVWMVSPKGTVNRSIELPAPIAPEKVPPDAPNGPTLQLVFTDAAGVRWRRDSDGHLELRQRPRRRR